MENPEELLDLSLVFQGFVAYQKTEALRAAIDIDLFTAIGAGATTRQEIAARCGASERGVRILADYLVVHRFLTKDAGRYALAPVAAMFLDRASPACLAPAIHFLGSPQVCGASRSSLPPCAPAAPRSATRRSPRTIPC